jgi:hypothetical protein
MLDHFTTTHICEIHGLNLERLKDWMRKGFVNPTQPAPKQGKKAMFTLLDVYGIGLFKDLIENGFSREAAAEYAKGFLKDPKALDANYILFRPKTSGVIDATVVGPGESKVVLQTGIVDSGAGRAENLPPRHPGQSTVMGDKNWLQIHLVNFKNLRKKIDGAISELF